MVKEVVSPDFRRSKPNRNVINATDPSRSKRYVDALVVNKLITGKAGAEFTKCVTSS